MNVRRRLMMARRSSIQVANVGDIAYKAANGKIMVVAPDLWDASLGTPVGVVVIPSGFAPDNGLARIMSLYWASSSSTSSTSASNMKWSTVKVDTSLTNHNRVPTTDNAGSTTIGSYGDGFLPSDKFTGATSYVDSTAKYYNTSYTPYIPSPYLGDKPNPAYYAPISGFNNALADFDGEGNTDVLVALGTKYVAAKAARNYKAAGAEEIEWYLPSMGELGYMMVRFNKIQAALTKVNAPQLDIYYGYCSSTEKASDSVFGMGLDNGLVSGYSKYNNYYTRPFAMLESYNTIDINNYLTIEALEDGLTARLSTNVCQYCVDGDGNWKTLAAGTATESINSGQTLSFRGKLTPNSSNGIGTFTISKRCNLKGNCMSMLFKYNAADIYSLNGKDYAFYKLFNNCNTIVNVSENFLPATTLANSCYSNMFKGCTSLTTAPALPATTLANSCYSNMFQTCSSLTTAPELPATTLKYMCYYYMFCDCIKLNYIKMLATDISASSCLTHWVYGVASSGTFIKHSSMTSLSSGSLGIPGGWTVVNDGEE